MRKNIGTKNIILSSIALLMSCSAMDATVFWNGTSTPDVVASLDAALEIKNNCTLTSSLGNSYVRVTADTAPITVTLDTDILVDTSATVNTLFLEPTEADITFTLNHSLAFAGVDLGDGGAPLLIAVRGGHNVIFNINGGDSFTLEPDGIGGGSVKFYVIMDGTVVQFNRTITNPANDVFIDLLNGATFGYTSTQSLGTGGAGTIQFNPTNAGAGRMALSLTDQSSVLISGRLMEDIDPYSYSLTLTYIDTTTPAGCQAVFGVMNTNTSASSRLLILNSNDTLWQFQNWNPTTYAGNAYGFVLSVDGQLSIGNNSYLDYVGLSLDQCFTGTYGAPCYLEYLVNPSLCPQCVGPTPGICSFPAENIFKKRNPSALIVDGFDNQLSGSGAPACINLNTQSAIVFRSGVDCNGLIENDLSSEYAFTVSASNRTAGAGNMVLDVEGCLTIAGTGTNASTNPTKIEILSLNVTPTGATVLINGTGSKQFPARDFATTGSGTLIAYNAAYFFINNNTTLCKTFLVHTDQNHKVYDNDDVRSEPTYVGGEAYKITGGTRPRILFSNSTFMIHTSLALTGLDLVVPNALACCLACTNTSVSCPANASPCDNLSDFIFFYNGYALDNGTGRSMIFGTYIGSTACNCCSVINEDAHLDVMQLPGQSCSCANVHELEFTVQPNNSTIIQNVPNNITGQYSVNSIYLGHGSNISIGSPADLIPTHSSCPILLVDGNYFTFGTRGGYANSPQLSNLTGQGGIFVDSNGTFSVNNTCGVNMGAMVTKSGNGVVYLPDGIVRFGCGVGEAQWELDLSTTPTIVPANTVISDYVLNWNASCKAPGFLPFTCMCMSCPANAATQANVTGLPTVLGQVDQLLINGSRIGDPAHIMVGLGGYVRELVFIDSCNMGFAPTAVVVLENDGRVGLGSAHTNVDSLDASVVLGNNGITIIANGNGTVVLNEDIVINNVCHIVQGPQFAASNRLLLTADCCRTIRVKSTGVLDLSSFTVGGAVEISGNVQLILEPGAQVMLGTVSLNFSGNAGIICEPVSTTLLSLLAPTSPTALNQYRVKFMGAGIINFSDCSSFIIDDGAFVGVETSACELNTNIIFNLTDNATWSLGTCNDLGGVFQIGNISHQAGATISCTLRINGNNAEFFIGQAAFVGLGVAAVSKLPGAVPNTWYVEQTYDVQAININVPNGIFSHDIIWDGNTAVAPYLIGSALALGSGVANFNIQFLSINNNNNANLSPSQIRGGGNLYLCTTAVPTTMNIQSSNNSTIGLLASNTLFQGSNVAPLTIAGSAASVFGQWRTQYVGGSNTQYAGRANAGPFTRNQLRLGYVDGPNAAGATYIGRQSFITIAGTSAVTVDQAHCIDIGAGSITLTSGSTYPRPVSLLQILV